MTFPRMRMTMKSDTKPIMRNSPIESVLKVPSKKAGGSAYVRPYNSANSKRRNSVTFDIGPIHEDDRDSKRRDAFRNGLTIRRMSAPELPPIQDNNKPKSSPSPMTVPRHRYLHSRSNNRSNTSDNSQRSRPLKSPFSAGSSESNNSHGQRRAPNSGGLRSKTWVPSDQTLTEHIPTNSVSTGNGTVKLEAITRKNGMSASTPRSTRNGYNRTGRLSSKDYSMSSGNNNTNSLKKVLKNSQSEPRIEPIENYTTNRQKVLKKTNSDQKFGRQISGKVLSIDKTDILTRNNRHNGTVNGMRRYSSTVQLNQQKLPVDDECYDDDSSSDSDKDQMIITWLIGVDTEDPEEPPEPFIEYPDEPPQTDTAVHIVYDGDT